MSHDVSGKNTHTFPSFSFLSCCLLVFLLLLDTFLPLIPFQMIAFPPPYLIFLPPFFLLAQTAQPRPMSISAGGGGIFDREGPLNPDLGRMSPLPIHPPLPPLEFGKMPLVLFRNFL